MIQAQDYVFDDLDELYETAERIPEVDRHDVHAHNEGLDKWEQIPYRDSLWTDDRRVAGVVSSGQNFYDVIQHGDISETVGDAVERHGIEPSSRASISPTARKMSAKFDFDQEVYANQDDPIDLGLQIQNGHNGFRGLKYDTGAGHQACSNGMTALISELGFDRTHGGSFQFGLTYDAVDTAVESPAEIEQRLAQAQNRELADQDEVLLILMGSGVGRYLEDPVPDLFNALYDEVDDPEAPTLWEAYNVATRALTHYTQDVPDCELANDFEQAAQLLGTGGNEIPEPEQLGRRAVDSRNRQLIEQGDMEPYWPDEEQALRELMEAHELQA